MFNFYELCDLLVELKARILFETIWNYILYEIFQWLKYLIINTYINHEKVKKIKMLQRERYGQTDKTER